MCETWRQSGRTNMKKCKLIKNEATQAQQFNLFDMFFFVNCDESRIGYGCSFQRICFIVQKRHVIRCRKVLGKTTNKDENQDYLHKYSKQQLLQFFHLFLYRFQCILFKYVYQVFKYCMLPKIFQGFSLHKSKTCI